MPSSSKVEFSVKNLTFSVAQLTRGISYIQGVFKRGPVADPSILVTSWPEFERLYGGLIGTSDDPHLAKRALEYGALLRVSRVAHYTDVSDSSTLTAVKATPGSIQVLTFDAALVTSNQIDMDVNGTAITPVVFSTDSNTTMALLVTELEANADIENAIVVDGGSGTADDRVIIVFGNTALTIDNADVTLGASQANIVVTTPTGILDDANNTLFTLSMKYHGEDYNNVTYTISDASNGDTSYFNLDIEHSLESDLNESYKNLKIDGQPDVGNSTYLLKVIQGSQLVDVTYSDLSALTGQLRPVNGVYYLSSGDDGDAVVAADYTGDSAGATGFYAFDQVDDGLQLGAPSISTVAIHTAGAAYAFNRGDLIYFAHLDNSLTTRSALVAARDSTNVDTRFCAFFAGGLKVNNPNDLSVQEISELGDIFGIAAFSDNQLGPWLSIAGKNRGVVRNVLGVVNNFGTKAKQTDLELLANRQINMVIQKDNLIYLKGNFCAQKKEDQLSFLNTTRYLIYVEKVLGPILENYLEEPADIPTFKQIFNAVEPTLESWVRDRAIFSYAWKGDQDISKIEDIVINNATDLGNGIYKVKLFLKIIPSMQQIGVQIVVTSSGVDFNVIP